MPEVEIKIGGRAFEVFCQDGEEHYLHSAAKMLDDEASVLAGQIGRLPEARMLLMAGLMLADKTAGLEDKLREAEARMAEKEAEIARLSSRPAPEPQKIEVAVIPPELADTLSELAARAEALADAVEEKAG
ncbi:MAG: cell division protein ZapA [Paracoccaceae bacterium]|jgi:cell division protein ZapA|uniref:cell division protein ZapA n=1 Tax=unclassified Seohaeicola TaxID=2641111 RepID=UPI00237C2F30|nr:MULTISPECIES: cell division protein ZapA [unclassified Seohaeicola]MDD9706129.1 cell division protein ZapA [Seohaeicola sp. 4SK31]MDD9734588.1 cell division protein ZapA [Seohaeicola sp. SP36]MDM7971004.1 cell division protein ZapA [Paracoccaceae bacterium]